MAYMQIRCGACRRKWEIYQRDNWNDDRARQCPHCFAKIDKQTWERQVLPTFGAFVDANMELEKDGTGYHKPVFSVNMILSR